MDVWWLFLVNLISTGFSDLLVADWLLVAIRTPTSTSERPSLSKHNLDITTSSSLNSKLKWAKSWMVTCTPVQANRAKNALSIGQSHTEQLLQIWIIDMNKQH